ncbi:hypothetical protein ACJX0J_009637, partial [Zea mays]
MEKKRKFYGVQKLIIFFLNFFLSNKIHFYLSKKLEKSSCTSDLECSVKECLVSILSPNHRKYIFLGLLEKGLLLPHFLREKTFFKTTLCFIYIHGAA